MAFHDWDISEKARSLVEADTEKEFVLQAEKKISEIVESCSYHPSEPRKSVAVREQELFDWLHKYSDLNTDYNVLGFDLESMSRTDENEYIPLYQFIKVRRNEIRYRNHSQGCNYDAILTDKYMFNVVMKSLVGESYLPKQYGMLMNGEFVSNNTASNPLEYLEPGMSYMIKPLNAACGRGIEKVTCTEEGKLQIGSEVMSPSVVCQLFGTGIYVIEAYLTQNEQMSKLNPSSVNTMRIVTVRKDCDGFNADDVEILGIYLRSAAEAGVVVDNGESGGIAAGVDSNGVLCTDWLRYSSSFAGYPEKFHPVSSIQAKGFSIPMFDEAIKLVKEVHRKFFGIKSIGWDVAICQNGPVLIEGNVDWGMHIQHYAGPLRRKVEKLWGLKLEEFR